MITNEAARTIGRKCNASWHLTWPFHAKMCSTRPALIKGFLSFTKLTTLASFVYRNFLDTNGQISTPTFHPREEGGVRSGSWSLQSLVPTLLVYTWLCLSHIFASFFQLLDKVIDICCKFL